MRPPVLCVPRKLLALTAALLLALTTLTLVPSTAHAEGDKELPEAMREDAAFDAGTGEESLDKIEVELEFQEMVNGILDPLIDAHYDIYAESGFTGADSAYIAFTDKAPPDVTEALDKYPQIELIEDAAFSADEADALMADVFSEVMNSIHDDDTAFVHISPIDGATEVAASTTLDPSTKDAVRKRITESISGPQANRRTSTATVTFESEEDLSAESTAVNGGDKLTNVNSTAHRCTAAFPAKSGSQTGLLTAGHCPNSLSVDGGNKLYKATKQRTKKNGDTQWHRSKVKVNPRFRYAWGSYRKVSAHPTLKVGTKVCRFGATTGNGSGCTKVKYVSSCIYYNNEAAEYCTLAMTTGRTGDKGGDSGGPWYYGNNAYGIHSGHGSRGGKQRNFFYPSKVALSKTGLKAMYG